VFFNSEHRQLPPPPQVAIPIRSATSIRHGCKPASSTTIVLIETRRGRIKQKANVTMKIDPRVIHCEHACGSPSARAPTTASGANANLLTDNRGPFDPQMGVSAARASRVAKLRPGTISSTPPLDDDEPVAGTRRIAASPAQHNESGPRRVGPVTEKHP
jgi:hypothetical protein